MNSVFKAFKKSSVSSVFDFINPPVMLRYGASNIAMMSYTSSLRALGNAHGITVNTIVLGFIQTTMTATFDDSYQPFVVTPEYLA